MAVQVRGTTPQFFDNVDKEVITLLKGALKELPPLWSQVINEKKSDRKFERVLSVVGVGDIPEKGEGSPYTSQVIREGWSKDFIHTEFGAMFEVTQTALEDEQHDQLSQHAMWFMLAARVVVEKRGALLYNNGFTTELSPDGVSIFNSAHNLKGGGTARNVLSVAADLSATSLEQALIDIQKETKLEAGQLVSPIQSFTLHIPPDLEFVAERILQSTLRPGVSDNDTNAVKNRRKWNTVINPYLTDSDAWFIQASNKAQHGLRSYTRTPLTTETPRTDPRTSNRLYPIRWRRSFGCAFWQNLFGSAGA